MSNLKSIAEATGVSIRTVSRALKNNGYVSTEVRARVCEAADRIGYRPNRYARALKTNKSCEVTALAWSTDELHMNRIEGLETALRARGYWVSLLMAHSFGEEDKNTLRDELLARSPAAIVALSCNHPPALDTLAELEKRGIPVILVDSPSEIHGTIEIDRQQGVYKAIRYLAGKGHRKIAYAGQGDPITQLNNARLAGYRRAITELDLPEIILTTAEEDQYRGGRNIGRRFAGLDSPPDAIQAYSDIMALGLLAGLQESGVSVPADVALIGFDNRSLSQYSSPPLSTVAQPLHEAGCAAAEMLLEMIDTDKSLQKPKVILPTKLIIRETA